MKKLIKIFACLYFVFFNFSVFAQTSDCEQLKTEVDYLKKVLKIQNEPLYKDNLQGLEIKVIRLEGSTRGQLIFIDALFTPTRPSVQTIKPSNFSAIDLEGNDYPAANGPGDYAVYLDVPQKVSFQIQNVNPSVTNLRLLKFNLKYYDNGWKSQEMTYRNVKINWK